MLFWARIWRGGLIPPTPKISAMDDRKKLNFFSMSGVTSKEHVNKKKFQKSALRGFRGRFFGPNSGKKWKKSNIFILAIFKDLFGLRMFLSLQMCLILSKPEYKLATTPQGLEKGPKQINKKNIFCAKMGPGPNDARVGAQPSIWSYLTTVA